MSSKKNRLYKINKKTKTSKKGGSNKNERWLKDKDYYNKIIKSICSDVKNVDKLGEKLTEMFGNKIKEPRSEGQDKVTNVFQLIPYCSEMVKPTSVKIMQKFDKVNLEEININVLQKFKDIFNYQYKYTKEYFIESENTLKPKQKFDIDEKVEKFYNYLGKYDFNEKNLFLVSHSNFMKNYLRYLYKIKTSTKNELNNIIDSIFFDNFDILQLVYKDKNSENSEKGENQLISIYLNKYDDSYNNNEKLKFTFDDDNIDNEKAKIRYVFIMRHCLACHNITKGIFNKFKQYRKHEEGYLTFSLCLKDIVCMLKDKKKDLLNLLKDKSDKFGTQSEITNPISILNKYVFGSSIIFRAILTSIIVYYSLAELFDDSKINETCKEIQNNKYANYEKERCTNGKFKILKI